jgi:hypothetical protein
MNNNNNNNTPTADTISISSSTSNFTNDSNSLKKQRSGTIKERRKLPRTNPNYVNVDLITNEGFVKNTYVRFDKALNTSKQCLTPTSTCGVFVNPLNNLQETSIYQQNQNNQSPTSMSSITSALFYSLNNASVLNQSLKCNNCHQCTCVCSQSTPVNSPYKYLTSSPVKQTADSVPTSQPPVTNEFTSSSNTLCNYPFVDESLTTRFRQQQQQQQHLSTSTFQHKSPAIKIKALNNTISYPSLSRRNIENKTGQSQSSISYQNDRPNSVFIGTPSTPHLPTPDSQSVKSIVSLQRTMTQPVS